MRASLATGLDAIRHADAPGLDESRADIRMQRLLGAATRDWLQGGQEPSFLLRGSRLEQYEGWAASTDLALTAEGRVDAVL